jgi:hypothetical protein
MKSSTAHYPKQHMFVEKQKKKNPEGEGAPVPERSRTHQRVFRISITETKLNRPMSLLTPHQSRTTWVLLVSF